MSRTKDRAIITNVIGQRAVVKLDFQVEDKFLTFIPIVDSTPTELYFTENDVTFKSNIIIDFVPAGNNIMFIQLLKNDIRYLFTTTFI